MQRLGTTCRYGQAGQGDWNWTADVVADRGYTAAKRFLACENEGVIVTLPKPMPPGAKRFGKQDFRYVAGEDVYICPAGERLAYSFTTQEHGLVLHRNLTNVCQHCAIKYRCTTGKERRITRWEHEHILEAVQRRLDEHPEKMRQRRETVEHPFGTIKASMGATHFLMKTLPRVASEMALHVLAYNFTRVMNIRPDARRSGVSTRPRPNSDIRKHRMLSKDGPKSTPMTRTRNRGADFSPALPCDSLECRVAMRPRGGVTPPTPKWSALGILDQRSYRWLRRRIRESLCPPSRRWSRIWDRNKRSARSRSRLSDSTP